MTGWLEPIPVQECRRSERRKCIMIIYNRLALRSLRGGTGETLAVKQTSLLGQLVEAATLLDQVGWCVEFRHSALVKDDDTIRVDDSVDAMRDCDDRAVLENTAT